MPATMMKAIWSTGQGKGTASDSRHGRKRAGGMKMEGGLQTTPSNHQQSETIHTHTHATRTKTSRNRRLLIKVREAGKDAVLRPQLMAPHMAAMNYSCSH